MLLGAMTIFDFSLGNAFCYYFAKFILMSTVYAHVVAKSRTPPQKHLTPPPATVTEQQLYSESEVTAPTQERSLIPPSSKAPMTEASSIFSSGAPLTSKNSSFANYLQWTKNRDSAPASAVPQTSDTQHQTTGDGGGSTTPTEYSVPERRFAKPRWPLAGGDAAAPYSATVMGDVSVHVIALRNAPNTHYQEAGGMQTPQLRLPNAT